MTFSAVGTPAPEVVFEASPDGENWMEIPDATVATDGDRTTVSVGIDASIDVDGWVARARFTNALGAVTTDLFTVHVVS